VVFLLDKEDREAALKTNIYRDEKQERNTANFPQDSKGEL
jgi:hypothetical protein